MCIALLLFIACAILWDVLYHLYALVPSGGWVVVTLELWCREPDRCAYHRPTVGLLLRGGAGRVTTLGNSTPTSTEIYFFLNVSVPYEKLLKWMKLKSLRQWSSSPWRHYLKFSSLQATFVRNLPLFNRKGNENICSMYQGSGASCTIKLCCVGQEGDNDGGFGS